MKTDRGHLSIKAALASLDKILHNRGPVFSLSA